MNLLYDFAQTLLPLFFIVFSLGILRASAVSKPTDRILVMLVIISGLLLYLAILLMLAWR